jgi:hypothetical protein
MTKAERIAALDAEFDSPLNRATGSLKCEEFERRRREIESEPDAAPMRAEVPPQRHAESPVVTMKLLEVALTELVAELRRREVETEQRAAQRVQRLEERIAELERAAQAKGDPGERWLKAV